MKAYDYVGVSAVMHPKNYEHSFHFDLLFCGIEINMLHTSLSNYFSSMALGEIW